jgi:hypothetical protein
LSSLRQMVKSALTWLGRGDLYGAIDCLIRREWLVAILSASTLFTPSDPAGTRSSFVATPPAPD